FQINPCIKFVFREINPSLILVLPCALYSVYTPSVGVVGLAEYVCTHSILNFYREKIQTSFPKTLSRGSVLHPTLPVDRVTSRSSASGQGAAPRSDPANDFSLWER